MEEKRGERIAVASSLETFRMQLLKSYLEEHGISAMILDLNLSADEAPLVGEARLMVRPEDESRARALITTYEEMQHEDPSKKVFPWVKALKRDE